MDPLMFAENASQLINNQMSDKKTGKKVADEV